VHSVHPAALTQGREIADGVWSYKIVGRDRGRGYLRGWEIAVAIRSYKSAEVMIADAVRSCKSVEVVIADAIRSYKSTGLVTSC
jgi:hypothetical protein